MSNYKGGGRPTICHCFSSSQSAYYFLDGQIEYMQKNGFDISFILPDDGFIDKIKLMYPGANVYILPMSREIRVFHDLKVLLLMLKLFIINRFSIIHLHTPKASLIGGVAAKLMGHKNVIYHVHGLVSVSLNKPVRSLVYYMEKIPFLLSTKTIAVSHSLRDFCIVNGYSRENKISVLGHGTINGIDAGVKFNPALNKSRVNALAEELSIPAETFVLGFLGRLHEDKGLKDIIAVAQKLHKADVSFILLLVGPDEIIGGADQYFKEELVGIDFKLLGVTAEPQSYIALFDVFLFPSYREGFGLVAAEANALEVPVVGYDVFGVSDAVENGVTGMLVSPGNTDELAAAVIGYINDPELRFLHGSNGRKRVEKLFKPGGVWKVQLEYYKQLIG